MARKKHHPFRRRRLVFREKDTENSPRRQVFLAFMENVAVEKLHLWNEGRVGKRKEGFELGKRGNRDGEDRRIDFYCLLLSSSFYTTKLRSKDEFFFLFPFRERIFGRILGEVWKGLIQRSLEHSLRYRHGKIKFNVEIRRDIFSV